MEKITNYGPILIRKGPYKGRIGYYDDTDMDGKLIIYPNVPIYCSDYYKVSQSAATSVIPTASRRPFDALSCLYTPLYP